MEVTEHRPKLVSFRALAFHGENKGQANGTDEWTLELAQEINLGLAVPMVSGAPVQAVVKIDLRAKSTNTNTNSLSDSAEFSATYEAKFDCPSDVTEEELSFWIEQEQYQYMLVSQAFPLAMTHFRRELQSMGFDARSLPLGL
jgi:hypothetical protein